MKLFLILSIASVSAAFSSDEWISFKLKYKKGYKDGQEENFRMRVFLNNKNMIDEHNVRYEQGLVSYKMKINQFGDMLFNEFSMKMNGFNGTKVKNANIFSVPLSVPVSIDWRKKGAVTYVKDQRECGSCWAFSTTGAIEGQNFRKTGKLISLSEQNLIDCSSSYGNNGCKGGLMDLAFQYIQNNDGVDSEESYPYEARASTCRFKVGRISAHVKGFVDIPSGDEESLKAAIASIGPISVAMDASHLSFQFYSSGVYNEPTCSSEVLDHGVLAVGYGNENGQDYWLIKNSWNTSWGDEGYVKIARNKGNLCGIATSASYPIV